MSDSMREQPREASSAAVSSSGGGAAASKNGTVMVASAAAVGATVGLIVAGPALAVVGAAGAGYAATTQGKAGDVSRSAGNLGLATFEAGKEFNEKHQIASKTVSFCPDVHPKPEPRFVLFDPPAKPRRSLRSLAQKRSASEAYAGAKRLDEKHQLASKTKSASMKIYSNVKEADRKYQVSTKTANALTSGMDALSRRLSSKKN